MWNGRTFRIFLAGIVACVCCLCAIGDAPPPTRVAFLLLSKEAEPFRKCEAAARTRLESEGWQVNTAVLDDKGKAAAPPDTSAMIAIGTEAAVWAKGRGGVAPNGVFCMVADAQGAGVLEGAALGGVLAEVGASEQVALIRKALPKANVIGVLFKKGSARGERWHAALTTAAEKAGMRVDAEGVEGKEAIAPALERMLKRGIDIYWTMADGGLYDANTIKAVLTATLEARVPTFGFSTPVVKSGALVGVGITPDDQGRQAAELLIRRATATGVPGAETVEPVFEITVNRGAAERLGITLPSDIDKRK